MIMEKMMNTKAERNTFTKKIGQTGNVAERSDLTEYIEMEICLIV